MIKVPVEIEIRVNGIVKFRNIGYFGKDQKPDIHIPELQEFINAEVDGETKTEKK